MATHQFVRSDELRARLEARRPRGKWASCRGIAAENDRLLARGSLPAATVEAVACPPAMAAATAEEAAAAAEPPRFAATDLCVANVDSLSAALALGAADTCVLSFANAQTPGGRYRTDGRAQEEDLCRLLPQLCPALEGARGRCYPIAPGTALLVRGLAAARRPGSYELVGGRDAMAGGAGGGGGGGGRARPAGEQLLLPQQQQQPQHLPLVTVIVAAMPCGAADRRPPGGWAGSAWAADVSLRIRSVLHAARRSGLPHLVLGAFGCGAFGNPAGPVASLFREQLASPEFRTAFRRVVFAVIDPLGTGNLAPFRRALAPLLLAPVRTAPSSGGATGGDPPRAARE